MNHPHKNRPAVSGRRLFVALCWLLLFPGALPVSAAEWRNHTNVNLARDLYPVGDVVWAATSGGLTMFDRGAVRTYTNADGLGANDVRFVTVAPDGRVWSGGPTGRLSYFNPDSGEWRTYEFVDRDSRLLSLTGAAPDGKILWVSSAVGLHKFDTERYGGEIRETYRRFGDLPSDEPASAVLLVGDDLWVATGSGCAVADRADINLQDYSRWRSFSRYNSGLTDDDIAALAVFDGIVFAATSTGLYIFTITDSDSTWSRVPGEEIEFRDLFSSASGLLAATSNGIYDCSREGYTLIPTTGMVERSSRAVCRTTDGTIWASTNSGRGFSLYDQSSWSDSNVAGISSNFVDDLAVTAGSVIWAVHPDGKPLSMFREGSWRPINSFVGGPTVNVLAVDHDGYLWLGGHGKNVVRMNPADPENDFEIFDETNSPLRGTSPPPDDWYIVTWDIAVDDDGRVWIANTFDYADRVLVFYDHGCWGYFGTGDGFPEYEPISLFALNDEVLVGFADNGLADFEIDSLTGLCSGGAQIPQVPTIRFFDDSDGLPTRQVRCSLVDIAGKIWVGTSGGLAYWDGILGRFRVQTLGNVAAPAVNALLADGGNNLWVGTDAGLFVVEPSGEVIHYTPENSGLVHSIVTALVLDKNANTLWIGTASGGISEFVGGPKAATPVEEILAYPNPYIISRGDEVLRFDAAFGTSIRIFTAAGELVANLGTATEWDGRNEAGNHVASGVYLIIAADAEGNYGRGKVVVMRK